ncbi:hypothetical protein NDU88_006966 [Pleurodeles waltl]|uniref:Secreted protein n=1 Tax=Pleurodeles waltl TaxID=8319 RepID=A0AAV7WC33_PLEWA|nr:hypothetical protein NDU88_006966 [Pleurodeles waltl]
MFYTHRLYCTLGVRDGPQGKRLQQPCVPLAMLLLLVRLCGDVLVLLRINNTPPESAVTQWGRFGKLSIILVKSGNSFTY